MINPTKVVPKRKGLVIIKKKRPEEQEVKEESEVKVPKINEQDKVIGNSIKTEIKKPTI